MPLHQTCQLKLRNLVGTTNDTLSLQDTCLLVGPVRLHCYVAAAATNMYSGLVLLLQTPLLLKHSYWLSDVQDGCLLDRCHSSNMPADFLPLIQYACRSFTTHSCMLAGVVYLYLPHLRVWCLTFSRACWCGASL